VVSGSAPLPADDTSASAPEGNGSTSDDVSGVASAEDTRSVNDPCDPAGAHQRYLNEFNQLLDTEGFSSDFEAQLATSTGIPVFGTFDICASGLLTDSLPVIGDLLNSCDPNAEAQGRCYCYDGMFSACRCARMTNRVLKATCAAVKECGDKAYAIALWQVHQEANRWLNSQIIGTDGFMCLGSPLVLDTAGDGIAPTSLEAGVSFAITPGVARTAWVQGDDALLVFDRNGNGSIDDGSELFGEHNAANGFAALARLDASTQGGNDNGLVEAGDLLFEQLQAWTDTNGDGVSQEGELHPLKAFGIVALELSSHHEVGRHDHHGNDLGLRALFHRADGRTGALVDVLFLTHAR